MWSLGNSVNVKSLKEILYKALDYEVRINENEQPLVGKYKMFWKYKISYECTENIF